MHGAVVHKLLCVVLVIDAFFVGLAYRQCGFFMETCHTTSAHCLLSVTASPDAPAGSVRMLASRVEGQELECSASQTNGIENLYLSLHSLALRITIIRQMTGYFSVGIINKILREIGSCCHRWPALQAGQCNKVAMSVHCHHKSVFRPDDITVDVARM